MIKIYVYCKREMVPVALENYILLAREACLFRVSCDF